LSNQFRPRLAFYLRGRQKFVMLILPQRAITALPFQPRRSHRRGWILHLLILHAKSIINTWFNL
jgi:hypothetical protein